MSTVQPVRDEVDYIHIYIHTYIAFHFIAPYKPFRYETCLQNLTNITDTHKTNIYTYI